jgi:hypothetical protein
MIITYPLFSLEVIKTNLNFLPKIKFCRCALKVFAEKVLLSVICFFTHEATMQSTTASSHRTNHSSATFATSKSNLRLYFETFRLSIILYFRTFMKKYSLQEHLSQNHSDQMEYSCEMCTFRTDSEANLLKHENSHARPFLCEMGNCRRQFSHKRSMLRHQRDKHQML